MRRRTLLRSTMLLGLMFSAGLGLAGSFLACGGDDAAAPTTAACPILSYECPAELPSYANEVGPIFAAQCNTCHNGEVLGGPWPLTNPIEVGEWASQIKGDLEDCLMPPPDSETQLSAADRQTLHTWLQCGAPNN